jgi:succinate dehydrogenase/fumarate reductase cytochrome b subunit
MAFEIYDDIAFFWFFETVLLVILIPFTFHMISAFRNRDSDFEEVKNVSASEKKKWDKILDEQRSLRRKKFFSFKTFIFVVLWLFFLYGILQVCELKILSNLLHGNAKV